MLVEACISMRRLCCGGFLALILDVAGWLASRRLGVGGKALLLE